MVIRQPRLERSGPDLWRVAAEVAGTDVFFESGLPLAPAPEAFVCAFLIPAMKLKEDLEAPVPLNAGLLENLKFIRRRLTQWFPELSHGEIHPPGLRRRAIDWWSRRALTSEGKPPHRSGLFYTGGVDSAYSLQQLHAQLDYVIFVEGFDVPLRDAARLEGAREWLGATTRACGVTFATLRTNLREHPVFNAITWELTFIAALAAVANCLAPNVNRMYVSTSDLVSHWGSTPQLDPYWSSDALEIVHFGADVSRLERVRSLAHWEPLRGRLRVCWENNSSDLNCGFCEKCLRTRVQLHVAGAPDGLDSFPPGYPLAETVGKLKSLHPHLHVFWRELAPLIGDAGLRREVDRLLH